MPTFEKPDLNKPLPPAFTAPLGAAAPAVDAGLRAHMLRVYNLMGSGLLLSAIVAWAVAHTALRDAFFAAGPRGNPEMTWAGVACALMPLGLLLAAALGRARAWSGGAIQALYWAFSASFGVGLSVLLMDQRLDVLSPFLASVAAFAGLSIAGYTTRRDLSALGSFCAMGLWGLIGLSLIGLFTGFRLGGMATGLLGVLVFSGLTAWETQRIKGDYLQTRDDSTGAAVWAAIGLYLDALNLFTSFVNLFNARD